MAGRSGGGISGEPAPPNVAMLHACLRVRMLALVVLGLGAGGLHAADSFDPSHALWGRVLSNHVAQALVDYTGLRARPAELDAYLEAVAAVPQAEFKRWRREDRLALLLNLYNAQTLRLIIDHYPLASIRSIGVLPGAAWRLRVVRFGGGVISLDHLEHQIIRKQYDEPRIHFALVCAAKGCPPLRAQPYVGARLDSQLEDQARRFLADSAKNRFEPESGTLWLSPIFEWYQDDFNRAGTLADYARRYLPGGAVRAMEKAERIKVRFTDYDWSLNEWQR